MPIRKHQGINQKTGRLKKGYKYGKKLKSGMRQIIKVKQKGGVITNVKDINREIGSFVDLPTLHNLRRQGDLRQDYKKRAFEGWDKILEIHQKKFDTADMKKIASIIISNYNNKDLKNLLEDNDRFTEKTLANYQSLINIINTVMTRTRQTEERGYYNARYIYLEIYNLKFEVMKKLATLELQTPQPNLDEELILKRREKEYRDLISKLMHHIHMLKFNPNFRDFDKSPFFIKKIQKLLDETMSLFHKFINSHY